MGKVEHYNPDTLHHRQDMGDRHMLQPDYWETSPSFGFHRRKLQSIAAMASMNSTRNQLGIHPRCS
jgi:hypothetical protein